MSKLRVNELILVEGRYDACALANVIDALILTTGGFSIFKDDEKKEIIRTVGKERGIVILTDSDTAGFRIRNYVEKILQNSGAVIKHAYIPEKYGKESRKPEMSREGLLGVEAMPPEVILESLQKAGVNSHGTNNKNEISYALLYETGLSGKQGSAQRRGDILKHLGIPTRLSKKALSQVLSSLYSREEFISAVDKFDSSAENAHGQNNDKPALFWDFHGTLTLPEVTWFPCAIDAVNEHMPGFNLKTETLLKHFTRNCLPWFTIESGDTRHLRADADWWAYCENQFEEMFLNCGIPATETAHLAKLLHKNALDSKRYKLYPDALFVLARLKKRGYKNYILSNNIPELDEIVRGVGMSEYIDDIYSSARIGYDKPHAEIYNIALKKAGMPNNPFMIGDSVREDIEGAAKAGFKTIAVHGTKSSIADYQINELAEILNIFT